MGGPTRTTALKAVALLVAVASLTINFGLIDLIDGYTGYVDQARNQVLDAGWGLIFGVILPLGLLAQLRRPERRIAGIQQTAVVGLVLALAGAAGEEWRYLALAAAVIAACAVLLALHPARRTFLTRGEHLDPVLLTLAAVAAGPSLVYSWRMASAQRRDLPPADAVSNGLHHWTVMTALGLLVLALVLLAALRPRGWRIPAMSASIAAAGWAISCMLAPELAAGSEGHAWAWAAIVWAVATLAATIWPRTRDRRVGAAALAPTALSGTPDKAISA
jgi:peptidoglycan/LPS O-acetylase OafA/YrhL